MSHRNRLLRSLAAPLAALWLLVGCSAEPPPPMRIGTNMWPGYEPLYLARDLGHFDDGPVQLKEYPSASEVIRAFRNGTLEAAALTLDEVLLLRESGMEMAVVLVMDVSDGGDVLLGRPGVGSMEALRGKRVGVEATALGAFMLSRALQENGLSLSEVVSVAMPVDEHERAWREGRVDAVVTFDPVRGKLLAAGASVLFDSSRIPGEVVDVLVVRRDYLERARSVVGALLTAWFRALDYLAANPGDAARRIVQRLHIAPEAFSASLEGLRLPGLEENRALLGGTSPPMAENAGKLHRVMLDLRLLAAPVDVETLFATPLVDRL